VRLMSDSDRALAVAFLDGDLAEPERTRFELRLAEDPDLAAEVERILVADEFVRRRVRGVGASDPRWRWRLVPMLLGAAAAAAVVVVLVDPWRDRAANTRDARICLRPSHESATEWLQDAPGLRGVRPPGLDELRGPGEPSDADPRAFVDAAFRIEASVLDAPPLGETTAGYFSIPVRIGAPADVLAFAFPANGSPHVLWPRANESARLAAGDHVLPSKSFELVLDAAGPRVEFRRGFLVPLGAGREVVVVGVRSASADEVGTELRAIAATATAQQKALEASGFQVSTFTVREP